MRAYGPARRTPRNLQCLREHRFPTHSVAGRKLILGSTVCQMLWEHGLLTSSHHGFKSTSLQGPEHGTMALRQRTVSWVCVYMSFTVRSEGHSAPCRETAADWGLLSLLLAELGFLTYKESDPCDAHVIRLHVYQAGVFGPGHPSRTPCPFVSVHVSSCCTPCHSKCLGNVSVPASKRAPSKPCLLEFMPLCGPTLTGAGLSIQ